MSDEPVVPVIKSSKAIVYFAFLENVDFPIDPTHIQALPKIISEEILQYKKQDDINRLTVGKYLLKKLLLDLDFDEKLFSNYAVSELGKPFIKGFHPFNISHTGQVVACAVLLEEGCIGIDVEKIREIDVRKFDKQFSAPEMMQILSSKNSNDTFFNYWTMKEAVMKADGRGMRIPLHSIKIRRHHATIDDIETEWNLYSLQLHESVKSHICSDLKLEGIEIKGWEIGELMD